MVGRGAAGKLRELSDLGMFPPVGDTGTQTHRDTQTQKHRDTDTQTHTQTQRQTHTHTPQPPNPHYALPHVIRLLL